MSVEGSVYTGKQYKHKQYKEHTGKLSEKSQVQPVPFAKALIACTITRHHSSMIALLQAEGKSCFRQNLVTQLDFPTRRSFWLGKPACEHPSFLPCCVSNSVHTFQS